MLLLHLGMTYICSGAHGSSDSGESLTNVQYHIILEKMLSPPSVPPFLVEKETLEGATKERCQLGRRPGRSS